MRTILDDHRINKDTMAVDFDCVELFHLTGALTHEYTLIITLY